WLRAEDDLGPGSPVHIHAIAVGDAELSPVARAQIDGEFGYLRGYDGLPEEYGGPRLDQHGGPVVCDWMRELGFDDLRSIRGFLMPGVPASGGSSIVPG
ncbi:MAG: hypothetical protein JW910_00780, partial [Anaerolineae bacterium]|nr:hypothetical protein [Anaerolineae bacterium]